MSKFGPWTRGQDEALLNKLGGMEVAMQLIACDKVEVQFAGTDAVVKGTVPVRKILRFSGTNSLPQSDPHNPKDFFQTRSGLFVWDEFKNRILPVAEGIDSLPPCEIASFDLTRDAYDAEIRAELPDDHVFSATEGCARIASMTAQQEGGKDGPLLTNGYANIFYVHGIHGGVFAVRVYWSAGAREWLVDAYRLDGGRWFAGRRFFPRTAAA